jgi:hypothetical protein
MLRRFALAAALLLATFPTWAATLYISEYGAPTFTPYAYQAAQTPELTHQIVAIGGSSVQSAAFSANTTLIRVHTDAICSVQIGGTNPTATATSARFIAGQTEYFIVHPGDKLAVITNN